MKPIKQPKKITLSELTESLKKYPLMYGILTEIQNKGCIENFFNNISPEIITNYDDEINTKKLFDDDFDKNIQEDIVGTATWWGIHLNSSSQKILDGKVTEDEISELISIISTIIIMIDTFRTISNEFSSTISNEFSTPKLFEIHYDDSWLPNITIIKPKTLENSTKNCTYLSLTERDTKRMISSYSRDNKGNIIYTKKKIEKQIKALLDKKALLKSVEK